MSNTRTWKWVIYWHLRSIGEFDFIVKPFSSLSLQKDQSDCITSSNHIYCRCQRILHWRHIRSEMRKRRSHCHDNGSIRTHGHRALYSQSTRQLYELRKQRPTRYDNAMHGKTHLSCVRTQQQVSSRSQLPERLGQLSRSRFPMR